MKIILQKDRPKILSEEIASLQNMGKSYSIIFEKEEPILNFKNKKDMEIIDIKQEAKLYIPETVKAVYMVPKKYKEKKFGEEVKAHYSGSFSWYGIAFLALAFSLIPFPFLCYLFYPVLPSLS